MPNFTKNHAEKTAKKLSDKTRNGVAAFQITEHKGGKHLLILAYYQGKFIFQFGIKHGSRRNAGHGWVCEHMKLSRNEGLDFANCHTSVDELISLLKDRMAI